MPHPPGLSPDSLKAALLATERSVSVLNQGLAQENLPPLCNLIQKNNFSGLVSNLLTHHLENNTQYRKGPAERHPDLRLSGTGVGLEVKATYDLEKGGEGHNGTGGWNLVSVYSLDEKTGDIRFALVMLTELEEYSDKKPKSEQDWQHHLSTLKAGGGTGHIDTYSTTPRGKAKLRDGIVYYDSSFVDSTVLKRWTKWRRRVSLSVPDYSLLRPSASKVA